MGSWNSGWVWLGGCEAVGGRGWVGLKQWVGVAGWVWLGVWPHLYHCGRCGALHVAVCGKTRLYGSLPPSLPPALFSRWYYWTKGSSSSRDMPTESTGVSWHPRDVTMRITWHLVMSPWRSHDTQWRHHTKIFCMVSIYTGHCIVTLFFNCTIIKIFVNCSVDAVTKLIFEV